MDGVSAPSGSCTAKQRSQSTCLYPKENNGTGSNWPNPRLISNVLLRQVRGLTEFLKGIINFIVQAESFIVSVDLKNPFSLITCEQQSAPKFEKLSKSSFVIIPVITNFYNSSYFCYSSCFQLFCYFIILLL